MIADPPTEKISGLGKLSVELLDAVGVQKASQLASFNPDVLHLDLLKANNMLSIRKTSPTPKEVLKWIEKAREMIGFDGSAEEVEIEEAEELQEMLVAVPISGKRLATQGIKATDIPVMETVVRGAVERKAPPASVPMKQTKPLPSKEVETVPEKGVSRTQVSQKSAVSKKNPLSLPDEKPEIAPLKSNKKNDVRTTVSQGLNEGKKEHSRSYIRGVLHPQVGQLRIASFVTLLMFSLMPASLAACWMIVKTKDLWWCAVPGAFVVVLFMYLAMASKMKCRICGQPVFSPKACRKHVKAHRIPLLGYIIPTSLHMNIFHWFRCIYCGTSVRLRK
ncbi:DUF4332 domain-containing protein [Akkermansiaceae bacterium]|nr:DUF4332 domain-containing protein [Akkermansiaceae bacterium]